MKIVIERGALLGSLQKLNRVVEKRNTYPVLANLALRASGNAIELRGTDLDIEVTDIVPAGVSDQGETTVPAAQLHDIVRKLPDGSEITIEAKDGSATVKAGRSRFNIPTISIEGFPELKTAAFTHNFALKPSNISALFGRTQFAISTEETRFYLNGVFLHVTDGGELRGVATDGHRLARVALPAPEGSTGMPAIIVPRKTVAEVLKLADGAKQDIDVDLNDTKIRFRVGDFVLLSNLIEGTFPDYERVTPKNNDKFVTVDRSALIKAADRVGAVASGRGGKAIKLTVKEGELALQCVSADTGEAEDGIPASYKHEVEGFEIGFNVRYLVELLGVVEGDEVRFAFNEAGSPTLITGSGDDWLGVLMPMRVS